VSTAQEIEEAIRALNMSERDKLLRQLPQLFPELAGDSEWERIIRDDQPRPGLSKLLDSYEAGLSTEPEAYPKVAESDFD
jgi:2-oxo-4-hydroxy-4-carboxy--5-ureidoimidazoline (OHCU) decarboxylase